MNFCLVCISWVTNFTIAFILNQIQFLNHWKYENNSFSSMAKMCIRQCFEKFKKKKINRRAESGTSGWRWLNINLRPSVKKSMRLNNAFWWMTLIQNNFSRLLVRLNLRKYFMSRFKTISINCPLCKIEIPETYIFYIWIRWSGFLCQRDIWQSKGTEYQRPVEMMASKEGGGMWKGALISIHVLWM